MILDQANDNVISILGRETRNSSTKGMEGSFDFTQRFVE